MPFCATCCAAWRIHGDVRSAQTLTSAQEEQLAVKFARTCGGKVHLSMREDKSLIGGMIVKIGSRRSTLSVRTRLERLERAIKITITTTQKGAA